MKTEIPSLPLFLGFTPLLPTPLPPHEGTGTGKWRGGGFLSLPVSHSFLLTFPLLPHGLSTGHSPFRQYPPALAWGVPWVAAWASLRCDLSRETPAPAPGAPPLPPPPAWRSQGCFSHLFSPHSSPTVQCFCLSSTFPQRSYELGPVVAALGSWRERADTGRAQRGRPLTDPPAAPLAPASPHRAPPPPARGQVNCTERCPVPPSSRESNGLWHLEQCGHSATGRELSRTGAPRGLQQPGPAPVQIPSRQHH